jgi:hypothetical protein
MTSALSATAQRFRTRRMVGIQRPGDPKVALDPAHVG